jgi:MFS family permease
LADGAFQMLRWSLCGDYCVRLSASSLDFDARVGLTGSRTVRAMITENSTKETQARAFSLFAFSGNLGIFLGPMLGTFNLTINIRSRADIGRRCTGRSSNADRRNFLAH